MEKYSLQDDCSKLIETSKWEELLHIVSLHKSISILPLGLVEVAIWLGLHFAGGAKITSNMIFNLSWLGKTLNFSLIAALTVTVLPPIFTVAKIVINEKLAERSLDSEIINTNEINTCIEQRDGVIISFNR
jgi:hypothetical protein